MADSNERYIVCMKWGTKYPADYVNRLYHMVRKNLSAPFTMLCLTDDETDIAKEIQCLPLPKIPVPSHLPERMWNKLITFDSNTLPKKGTALFLDLDVLIVDDLEPFFRHPGEFLIIQDYLKKWRGTGNSSVYRWQLGDFDYVYAYFLENMEAAIKAHHNEQEFLTWAVNHHPNHTLDFWPTEWCPSYKYDCVSRIPFAFWVQPRLPENSKIVIFHGEINPDKAIKGGFGKWYRYVQPAKWVEKYWNSEG